MDYHKLIKEIKEGFQKTLNPFSEVTPIPEKKEESIYVNYFMTAGGFVKEEIKRTHLRLPTSTSSACAADLSLSFSPPSQFPQNISPLLLH